MNRNVKLKAEQIARYVVGGCPLTRVALEMGMSYDGLLRITRTQEYLDIEDEVRRNVLGAMDAKLAARADLRQKMADEMEDDAVPEAFKIVLDNLRKKRDLKTALEVLDRDPRRQFARTNQNADAAGKTASAPAAVQRPPIDSTALAEAIKEADITHTLIERTKQKPANA